MRLGIALPAPVATDAQLAERLGFDLIWIDERASPAPLVTAAALAPATSSLLLGAVVRAGPHPLTLAEEAAVADLVSGGRLVLGLESDDHELLAESVDLMLAALAARPFAHQGPRWRVPARLPEHHDVERRVRMTPPPRQLELPVWLAGAAGATVARPRGLSFVSESAEDASGDWAAVDRLLGPAGARMRRPALRSVEVDPDGALAVAEFVASMRAERDAWGVDVLIVRLPDGIAGAARERAMHRIADSVRPQLALDETPPGLAAHWRSLFNQPVD